MKTYKMQNKKIAVIPVQNKTSKSTNSMFITLDDSKHIGVVHFTFEGSNFPVGTKVFFGNQKERFYMGQELDIMEESNIIAVVEE